MNKPYVESISTNILKTFMQFGWVPPSEDTTGKAKTKKYYIPRIKHVEKKEQKK